MRRVRGRRERQRAQGKGGKEEKMFISCTDSRRKTSD